MKYLTVDGELHGTGIRDYYNGGFINPEDLHLNATTIKRMQQWLLRYENEHYGGYVNDEIIKKLDSEGKEIALTIKNELLDVKVEYFSAARMTRELIL